MHHIVTLNGIKYLIIIITNSHQALNPPSTTSVDGWVDQAALVKFSQNMSSAQTVRPPKSESGKNSPPTLEINFNS